MKFRKKHRSSRRGRKGGYKKGRSKVSKNYTIPRGGIMIT